MDYVRGMERLLVAVQELSLAQAALADRRAHRIARSARVHRRGPGRSSRGPQAGPGLPAGLPRLDGLKRVNDDGHDAGDAVIPDVAGTLRSVLGPADVVARAGGDEFCILVTEPDECSDTLKARLVESFLALNEVADRRHHVLVSLGLVRVAADDTRTLQELVAAADELMYADTKGKADARIAV